MPAPALVLCVDAGGTKCQAAIASCSDGRILGTGTLKSPCNYTTEGIAEVIRTVGAAVTMALIPMELYGDQPHWEHAVVGLSGLESASDEDLGQLHDRLALTMPARHMRICRDSDLLGYALCGEPRATASVCVVCGTGSVVSLVKLDHEKLPKREAQTGGWGHLLGDEGSGYAIGRSAIRSVLNTLDEAPDGLQRDVNLSSFQSAVFDHFAPGQWPHVFLSHVLRSPFVGSVPSKVASVCPVVFEHALDGDKIALSILEEAASGLSSSIATLVKAQRSLVAENMLLVACGGVIGQKLYQDLLFKALDAKGLAFLRFVLVTDASTYVASELAKAAGITMG